MVSQWCPKLFMAVDNVAERTPEGWYVSYVSTDTTLLVKERDKLFVTQPRTNADLYLGTLADWEAGVRPDCAAIPRRLRDVYSFE
jgi:hypothetical protein